MSKRKSKGKVGAIGAFVSGGVALLGFLLKKSADPQIISIGVNLIEIGIYSGLSSIGLSTYGIRDKQERDNPRL